jgi:hypothetical protein
MRTSRWGASGQAPALRECLGIEGGAGMPGASDSHGPTPAVSWSKTGKPENDASSCRAAQYLVFTPGLTRVRLSLDLRSDTGYSSWSQIPRLARGYKGSDSTPLLAFTNLSFVHDSDKVDPEGNARFIWSTRRTIPPFSRHFYFQRRYVRV